VTQTGAARPWVDRDERERQILDAATSVFAERGYRATSMESVASRVGVTKPVLYDHFGSKEGLLLACIARARQDLLSVTADAVADADGPEDMVRQGVRSFFRMLDENGTTWALIAEAEASDPDGPAVRALEGIRDQQTEFIAGLLGMRTPGEDRVRLEAYAQVVVGATERLALWRARRGGIDAELATEYLMDMLWSGMGHRRKRADAAQ
jgi:AcrR family transcriptional regulator